MTWQLDVWERVWPMAEPFVIARGAETEQPTLQVRLTDAAGLVGRGEGCGVGYAGETPATMAAQIDGARAQIEQGVTRADLLTILPPGGARCAVDAALWDLEAKRTKASPFEIAGVAASPVVSDRTIGIRSLEAYEQTARRFAAYRKLKVKVNAVEPIAAIAAVRRGAPGADLIVDPNQSWSVDMIRELGKDLVQLNVKLLEQPIPVGDEDQLDGFASPVPLCADELINDAADLAKAEGRFHYINIKLDKTGGLTAGLELARAAQARGFALMVGCMSGSSLSMAPAMVLAQLCTFVDLDGPLLQAEDFENGFVYENGLVRDPLIPSLWG